jgi:hypothetical protein
VVVIIILSVVLGVMLLAFLWFYWYSRTLAWGESETRKAFLRMLIVVGPIFGMHYREPHPEHPTIATPKPREEDTPSGVEVTTAERRE